MEQFIYEEVPKGIIDNKIKKQVFEAANFAQRDLDMAAVPLYYVRQLGHWGGGRKHSGLTFRLYITNFYGAASFETNQIFLDVDRCKDYTNTVLHEYRHIKMGFRESDKAIEYDAELYAYHAERAMHFNIASRRNEFFRDNVVHTQDNKPQIGEETWNKRYYSF